MYVLQEYLSSARNSPFQFWVQRASKIRKELNITGCVPSALPPRMNLPAKLSPRKEASWPRSVLTYEQLNITGFVLLNSPKQGKVLYKRTKKVFQAM